MGSAIAASLRDTDYTLAITARTQSTLDRVKMECPQAVCTLSNTEAVHDADIVVLAVKPYVAPGVIAEIAKEFKPGCTVASVVAGIPTMELDRLIRAEGKETEIVRVIPNTAIRLGKSATFIAGAPGTGRAAIDEITAIFNRSGKTFEVAEKDMGACCALSSCGIAYFLRFIRAAVEGSVELGLRPGFATEVAAATAVSAAAVLEGVIIRKRRSTRSPPPEESPYSDLTRSKRTDSQKP